MKWSWDDQVGILKIKTDYLSILFHSSIHFEKLLILNRIFKTGPGASMPSRQSSPRYAMLIQTKPSASNANSEQKKAITEENPTKSQATNQSNGDVDILKFFTMRFIQKNVTSALTSFS